MREQPARSQPIQVLIVDDDDAVRAALDELLREEGVEVVGLARDGEEGVSLALSLNPDVVLLDVRMPRLNGLDAARQLRPMMPQTKIVMLSAYDDKTLVSEAESIGVDAFLVKGCPLSELIESVAA